MKRRIRAYLDEVVRERVVAHTKGGASIEGVLVGVYEDVIVLKHAAYLSSTGRTVIDGEALVPRTDVGWIQRPGEEE